MEFIIDDTSKNQRIDKFLKRVLPDAPVSFIYKMFRQKDVKVNNKKVDISYILQENDNVFIYIKDDLLKQFKKEKLLRPVKADFEIIYEDENILVINKPKGLLVHGDKDEKRITLQNMVLNYLSKKGEFDINAEQSFVPSPAHRLDRNTSGIVIFGKNLPTLQQLLQLFRERTQIEKKYTLLVRGITDKEGLIDLPLIKDSKTQLVKVGSIKNGAKEAKTKYKRLKSYSCGYSLVEAELLTGRTHQLRVHFAYISHPIVGDAKYGDFKINKDFEDAYKYKNQFLHASYFRFNQLSGRLSYLSNKEFVCDLSVKEKEILDSLAKLN